MYHDESLFLKFINSELLNFLTTTDPIQDLIAVLFPSSYSLWFLVCALGLRCLWMIMVNYYTADITTAAHCYMCFCPLSLQLHIAFALTSCFMFHIRHCLYSNSSERYFFLQLISTVWWITPKSASSLNKADSSTYEIVYEWLLLLNT